MNDREAREIVLNLRHRVGAQHSCPCVECRAVKRICALALEAIQRAESAVTKNLAQKT